MPPAGTSARPRAGRPRGREGRAIDGCADGPDLVRETGDAIAALVADVLVALGRPGPAPGPVAPPPAVVVAPGADGRAAAAAALYAAADALVLVDAAEVAEPLYDLAADMDVVLTVLGPTWCAAVPADRPLLVLRWFAREYRRCTWT